MLMRSLNQKWSANAPQRLQYFSISGAHRPERLVDASLAFRRCNTTAPAIITASRFDGKTIPGQLQRRVDLMAKFRSAVYLIVQVTCPNRSFPLRFAGLRQGVRKDRIRRDQDGASLGDFNAKALSSDPAVGCVVVVGHTGSAADPGST